MSPHLSVGPDGGSGHRVLAVLNPLQGIFHNFFIPPHNSPKVSPFFFLLRPVTFFFPGVMAINMPAPSDRLDNDNPPKSQPRSPSLVNDPDMDPRLPPIQKSRLFIFFFQNSSPRSHPPGSRILPKLAPDAIQLVMFVPFSLSDDRWVFRL